MSNGQSSIQNVYSRSFTGQNLFEVSLVKDTNPELPFYKPRYFFFLSMTPGATGDGGQKTYDRQNRVTLKCDSEKLSAFAHATRAHAKGQGQNFGQFAIFSDPSRANQGGNQQNYKVCFPSTFNAKNNQVNVSISFKVGQNQPFGIAFSIPEAVGFADFLEFMANKSYELDFDTKTLEVGKPNQSQGTNQPSQPQGNNPPPQPAGSNGGGGGGAQQVQNDFQQAMNSPGDGSPFVDDAPF